MNKISIIVPVYKTEKYLSQCIESILKQTYVNFELILVNDGSPDNSQEILNYYQEKDKRIKIIEQENQGLSMARNNGFKEASGDYISFIDSDDWIHPRFLEILLHGIEETKADISIVKYAKVNDRKKSMKDVINFSYQSITGEEALYKIYENSSSQMIVAWNKLYKRQIIEKYSYPKGKLHEDEFTTYKYLAIADKVCLISCELYYYFFNNNGIMNSGYKSKRLDIIEALEERISFFEKNNKPELIILSKKSYFIQLLKNYFYTKKYLKDKVLLTTLRQKINKTANELINSRQKFKYQTIAKLSKFCPYLLGKLVSSKNEKGE